MPKGLDAPDSAKAGEYGVNPEKLHTLWSLVTRQYPSEEARMQAILEKTCALLGVDVSLVGEIVDGQYLVRHACDPQGRFPVGMAMPLEATPCQVVFNSRSTVFHPEMARQPAMADLPMVAELNMQAYVGTPIWIDGRLWGVLAFAGMSAQTTTRLRQEDIAFIELVASWVGMLQSQAMQKARLESLALTDEMTGLPNRRAAEARLREEIAHARRQRQTFVLGLVDLDHFKLINDRYGHRIGDEALACFAKACSGHLRADDWVARWGGEEFLVCLHTGDIKQAETVFDRLREALKHQAFETSVGAIHLTLSVGLSRFDLEKGTQDSLLANLDSNLYEAKSRGRDRIVGDRHGLGVLQIASQLKEAASEDRILAAYQPIVNLATREIVADEALARLQTPGGDILNAESFIDAAEGLNLMADIDCIVATQAMGRCAYDLATGALRPHFAHFINLSPQFLARRDLVRKLLERARVYCMTCGVEMGPIKPIVFEITERQAIMNLDTLEEDLKYLLDFGFRLALDDFGSGYSSFLYLSRLPVSFLKIEGWMIQNMQSNAKAKNLIKSLVDFARNQGITTIAEGVEDEETARRLHEVGVDWAQGFHFGYPELAVPPVSARP
ncbi:MAG: EAL domain-containing protein [Pseudomonadota bacterium]